MGEPEEDRLSTEYYDLIQKTCFKRTVYPENCASLLYDTLKVEDSKQEKSLVELPDKDQKSLTNLVADILASSLMSNKVLEESSRYNRLKQEDLQKKFDCQIKRCKDLQSILKQISNEPKDGVTHYLNRAS